ncbi:arylesterase [Shewanella marinintestina]|uniref:Arylesterase n=1 Tax=Shewanella sairae TaxID=190310 RepID=A0ABQ4PNP8_9GAMM|nr:MULTISPECIES: arylesterase [Shewanella]MCL1130695.1 arylesterase [Shewanella sairae]MCL1147658.1 arylesterase [Shewanella marinintestina]GIU50145.1 arylesterase [Shewanella sairae]
MALFSDIESFFNVKNRLRGLVLLLVFSSFGLSATPILILGDSLSASYGMPENQGWVQLLREKMPNSSIINGSVSGETSAGGLRRLPALLESAQPKILLIELGGNDGLRGFPPKQLKNNLTKIIELAKAQQVKVLLSEIMVPPNYGPRYASQINTVYKDLATEHDVTLMPFFMEQIVIDPSLMQRDGIHPNQKAQIIIAEFMLPWFEQAL